MSVPTAVPPMLKGTLMPRADDQARGMDVLLVTAKQAAAICATSVRTWRTRDSAGLIPRPVRIGRSVFWCVDELRDWVAAGCPRRIDWESRQRGAP
jgi:predicted DNA-binding transcriptional regulator AlpA